MAIADETTLRIVLYEGAGAATLDAAERGSTLTALLGKGYGQVRLNKRHEQVLHDCN